MKSGLEIFGLYSIIGRKPLTFTSPQEMPPEYIGQEIISMLPRGQKSLTERRIKEVDFWFGKHGHHRAIHYDDLMTMVF